MSDRLIGKIIMDLKSALDKQAHDSMTFAHGEPFQHGTQVGVYQGLLQALDVINAVLEDADQRERNS